MSRLRGVTLALALSACSAPSGAPVAPARADAAQAATQGVSHDGCREALAAGVKEQEAEAPPRRVAPGLRALGGCGSALGPQAAAAAQAAALERPARAARLRDAAAALASCPAADPVAPAASLAEDCCAKELEVAGSPVLKDLDAGTCLFLAAVRRELARAGVLEPAGRRVLANLILGAALQGEEARKP